MNVTSGCQDTLVRFPKKGYFTEVMMKKQQLEKILSTIENFIRWLSKYGETSYDHQSYFAGPIGGRAKGLFYKNRYLGIAAVAPMIFSEAFVPAARRLFWKKLRFPIADAHYAMGFALLYNVTGDELYHKKAVHFLDQLILSRSPGYEHYCWGYPFNWVTRNGICQENIPFITTTPYVYEAFDYVYQIDNDTRWLEIMRSIAEHALNDIKDFDYSANSSSCSYSPVDKEVGVINASAYRAFLLTSASIQFSEDKYWKTAERNINFVLENQNANGSWYYAVDNVRDFVDHYHTCFVLKALAKIEELTGRKDVFKAIEIGVRYYMKNLFNKNGMPKPFSKAPRLTVYKNELYDYAECINICVLLNDRFEQIDDALSRVIDNLLSKWLKRDGSFRSRRLHLGWDNVPMHRWAQSQMFRSLCYLLYREKQNI